MKRSRRRRKPACAGRARHSDRSHPGPRPRLAGRCGAGRPAALGPAGRARVLPSGGGVPAGWEGRIPAPISCPLGARVSAKRTLCPLRILGASSRENGCRNCPSGVQEDRRARVAHARWTLTAARGEGLRARFGLGAPGPVRRDCRALTDRCPSRAAARAPPPFCSPVTRCYTPAEAPMPEKSGVGGLVGLLNEAFSRRAPRPRRARNPRSPKAMLQRPPWCCAFPNPPRGAGR
jgi:hypothetical protein